jgi:hypothetical protein
MRPSHSQAQVVPTLRVLRRRRAAHSRMLVASLAAAAMALSAAPAAASTPVYPPGSAPVGASYRTWAERWGTYAFSAPIATNPLVHPTDCDLAVRVINGVVFLPASGSGRIHVECSVPEETPLLMTPGGELETIPAYANTPRQLRRRVTTAVDAITDVRVRVDGTALRPIDAFRAHSRGTFPLFVPKHNILGESSRGVHTAYVDGYFLMLRGFEEGTHVVRAHDVFPSGSKLVSATTVYTLHVENQ